MKEAVWGIDTIDANVDRVPLATPVIWAYVTGTTLNPEIEWELADLQLFPHSTIYRIDQGFGDQADEVRAFDADEYDLEARAWTVDRLVRVIQLRNERRWSTRVYASVDPYTALIAGLAAARVPTHSLYYREANWDLNETEAWQVLTGNKYAAQWASPSSNPLTVIPGTSVNLQAAGADLNMIRLGSTQWQGP